MSDPQLQKIIASNNKLRLEKYIKHHLPNNPQDLQRIYNQLQSLSLTLNQIIKGKRQIATSSKAPHQNQNNLKNPSKNNKIALLNKHSSLKIVPPSDNGHKYFQRNKQQNITKRQQILVRSLRQKGLRPSNTQLGLGLQVIQKEQMRIGKPLQSNKNIVFKQNTSIMKCIKKFNLNKNFYSNNIEDGYIDEQKFYDRQMKAFLQRRKGSLSLITQKKQFTKDQNISQKRRFSQIQSKLFSNTALSLGLQSQNKFQSHAQRNNYSSLKDSQNYQQKSNSQRKASEKTFKYLRNKQELNKQIISCCNKVLQEVKDSQPKSLMYEKIKFKKIRKQNQELIDGMMNIFAKLQQQKQELYDNSEQLKQLAKMGGKEKLIQKYTLSYLKSIKTKTRNEIILSNRNDLIKNEAKFRNLIAQHKG